MAPLQPTTSCGLPPSSPPFTSYLDLLVQRHFYVDGTDIKNINKNKNGPLTFKFTTKKLIFSFLYSPHTKTRNVQTCHREQNPQEGGRQGSQAGPGEVR